MVKYSVERINTILLPVRQVPGQQTFCTLWQFSQELQECLEKMEQTGHPEEGYAGYMMVQVTYALYSTILLNNPNNIDNYLIGEIISS